MPKDFLKEIEVPGILEILGERWDNALELIHEDALVYGGAIRDIIAGLPLKGDLDIVGSSDPYSLMVYAFAESAKWTPEGWVPPVDTSQGVKSFGGRMATMATSSRSPSRQSSPSKYTKHIAVDDTTSFLTFDNAKVQLVRARPSKITGFKAALQVAKEVDIVCCGLIMDKYGRVFEVIEGAYDDCVNKVLRFNKTAKTLILDDLKIRIAKLKDRGWASKINISRLRKVEEKAAVARRSEEERMRKTQKKEGRQGTRQIRSWLSTAPGKKQVRGPSIPEIILDIDGLRGSCNPATSLGFIRDVIENTAEKDFGLKKDSGYKYKISSKGVITVLLRTERAIAVDYAHIIADKMERYGDGTSLRQKTGRVSGRIWESTSSSYSGKTRITKRGADIEEAPLTTDEEAPQTTRQPEKAPPINQRTDSRGFPIFTHGEIHAHGEATVEYVESPRETLTFKATIGEGGDIEINSSSEDLGENLENFGSVEIDISSIPEEAQERVKQAFEESRQDHHRLGGTSAVANAHKVGKTQKVKQAGDRWGYGTKTKREV